MKALRLLAILLPLVKTALAATTVRPIKSTICKEYKVEEDEKWMWSQLGFLLPETTNKVDLYRSIVVKVRRNGANGARRRKRSTTHYTYTISGGILAIDSASPQAFAKIERAHGKGLGQAFVISFYDANINKKILKQYKIYPNEECKIPSPFTAAQLGKISVWAKTD